MAKQYLRRVDICLYPAPAASIVATRLKVEREGDALVFKSHVDKRRFDRHVQELQGNKNG